MFRYVRLLYLMYLNPWILHINVTCSHFQQFLHCRTPRFIFAPWTVEIKLPTLKHLLISLFALLSLCVFQISSQMMSNFGDILIILGLEAINILLNIWFFLRFSQQNPILKKYLCFQWDKVVTILSLAYIATQAKTWVRMKDMINW